VKVKFGFKAWSMLSSLALAIAFVAGCTEETPPDTAKPVTPAVTPAKPPGGDMMKTTPAMPPKADEKPK
jgi:hypothetical protein